MKPIIAMTMWRRTVPTFLSEQTDLHTLVDDYAAALDVAGTAVMLIGRLDPADVDAVLDRVDGLVITGGGDFDPACYGAENTHSVGIDRAADRRDLALVDGAQKRRMPLLGICRGLQAINIALGGTLRQEVNGAGDDHPTLADTPEERNAHRHLVRLESGCRLATLYGTGERKVNSLHHQGAERIGSGLRVVGRTADGNVEAIETADAGWPMVGVQWHPEMLDDPLEERLFAGFVTEAARYRRQT